MAKPTLKAEDVRRIRRQLGETQAEFARRFAVDAVTVARWETGRRRCSGLHALTIARLDPEGWGLLESVMKESKKVARDHSVVALFSHKGGVSKTTTTYHLGWSLARRGKRVLLVDGDPQCNLTGMTLSLAGETDFEKLYASNRRANLYEALLPAFESRPEPIAPVECFETPGCPGLYLLPGHVSVAEYDVPLGVAHELSGSLGVMKNLPGAINKLLQVCAEELGVDFILIDMSPAISALNQNLFTTSTHFIVPCSPDYFCALAIDSLSKILPRWAEWPRRAAESGLFDGAAYPIPTRTPRFLGTINQRFRPRYGAPAKAFQLWIDRINDKVKQQLVPVLAKHGMLLPDEMYDRACANADPYSLANIADFNSLIARSQESGVPIFELTEEHLGVGGQVLENTLKSRDAFAELFNRLAEAVMVLTEQKDDPAPTRR